jgi:hypothetical protein
MNVHAQAAPEAPPFPAFTLKAAGPLRLWFTPFRRHVPDA